MIFLHYLTLLCLAFASTESKSIKKSHVNLLEPTFDEDEKLRKVGMSPPEISSNVQRVLVPSIDSPDKDWQGSWFPHAPGDPQKPKDNNSTMEVSQDDNWQGKWFPQAPGKPHVTKKVLENSVGNHTTENVQTVESTTEDHWQGKWFPQSPNEPHKTQPKICDDGKSNLAVDYDPNDIRDSLNYLCISSNRSLYQPDLTREAILTEHFLPSAYVPPSKCLNEPISYSHLPVTNGPYRPLPAEYGTYSYLPPQRYVRNLAEGAIVMLHHPCAFPGQVQQLQDIVTGCLYRHLVSTSQALSPERPLALLAWSRSLEMSVVDRRLVADFIRKHARQGPLAPEELSRVVDKRATYKEGLLSEAHLVTTADDYELCGYLQEEM